MTNEFENEYATHNKSIGMTRDRYRSHSENDMRKVLAYAEKELANAEQDLAEASAPRKKPKCVDWGLLVTAVFTAIVVVGMIAGYARQNLK